jgi:hypothetical protein
MDNRARLQQLQDIDREQRREAARKQELLVKLQWLVKQPAWQDYVELLNKQLELRGMDVLEPAGSVDGVIFAEYKKGAMSGLILARDLPAAIIAEARDMQPDEDED